MVKDKDSIIFIVNGSCIGSNSQHCFVYKGVTVSGLFGNLYGVNGWYISLTPGIHVLAK